MSGQKEVKNIENSSTALTLKDTVNVDDSCSGSSLPSFSPEHTVGWIGIAGLLCADIIGAGVLTIGVNIGSIGWVVGLSFLFLSWPCSAYTGYLLQRVLVMLPSRSMAPTMMDMGTAILGKYVGITVQVLNWIVNYVIVLGYVTVTTKSLGATFYDVHWCVPVWSSIVIPSLMAMMMYCRTQKRIAALTWPSMALIVIAIAISVISMFSGWNNRPALKYGNTKAFADGLSSDKIIDSLNQLVFAYSGQNIYVEIMAEMKEPRHFKKSLITAGTFQVSIYFIVALISNLYSGQDTVNTGMITTNIPLGGAYRAANAFLFAHMITVFPITTQVIVRPVHYIFDKKSVNEESLRGYAFWFLSVFIVVGSAGLLAILFPYVSILQSMTGAFLAVPCFVVPGIYYYGACHKYSRKVGRMDHIGIIALCFVVGMTLFVYGLYSSISNLSYEVANAGGFFACNCDNMWDVCPASS